MKKMTLILLVILITGCAGSQKTAGIKDSTAPSSTNAITVHTNLDAKRAYRKVGQILQDNGYTLRSSDATLLSITTDFKEIKHGKIIGNIIYVRLSMNVRGDSNSMVSVKGWFNVKGLDTEHSDRIKKFGQNGSPIRNAWKEMYQVANSLGDSLNFQKN